MKIIIVGNGEDVLQNEYGNLIDSFDIVIRMGQYQIDSFEKNVGTKTDIYSAKWFAWWDKSNDWKTFRKMDVENLSEVWFQFTNPMSNFSDMKGGESPFEQEYISHWAKTSFVMSNVTSDMDFLTHRKLCKNFGLQKKKVIYYNSNQLLDMIRLLKFESSNTFKYHDGKLIEPTTGIKTIQMALEFFPNAEIYIIGFDGFTSSWYWNSSKIPNPKHDYPNERIVVKDWLDSGKIHRLETLCVC